MERIIREVRRRTRVVGAFPDGKSALTLVAARLRHIAGTQWGENATSTCHTCSLSPNLPAKPFNPKLELLPQQLRQKTNQNPQQKITNPPTAAQNKVRKILDATRLRKNEQYSPSPVKIREASRL